MRAIARTLQRSVSSISDELRRNKVRRTYDPKKAQHKAYVRRKYATYQGMHIVKDRKLREFVEKHLYDDLSPEAIAGRLTHREKKLKRVSKNSIYRYIRSVYGRGVEAHRAKKKKARRRRAPTKHILDGRIFIDKRPVYINKRRTVGHAEADFIVSGKTGKGILLVMTDRKLRVAFLERIMHVSIAAVHDAFLRIQERFPELRTITTDNDLLFQKHKELERELGVTIYFCHPYHSWEKGTVENTNKYIRKDIPKGSSISKYSKRCIRKIENKLNRRPLKCLRYKTPSEALAEVRRKTKKRLRALVRKK